MRESKFKNYDALPLTLTAPEVGEVLGISRAAAYELVRSKGFPHIRIGTRILVPKDKFKRRLRIDNFLIIVWLPHSFAEGAFP